VTDGQTDGQTDAFTIAKNRGYAWQAMLTPC